ncbi:hypothetical protein ACVI1K_005802 [Bradyrhizobium sp. USDA 4508]
MGRHGPRSAADQSEADGLLRHRGRAPVGRARDRGAIEGLDRQARLRQGAGDRARQVRPIGAGRSAATTCTDCVAATAGPGDAAGRAARAPLDATSVPSIEELLARLKSKSAATAPGEALAPVPLKPEPLGVEPRKVEPARSELPQAASVAPEPSRAESRALQAPKAESLTTAPAKADPITADPIKSELPTSELPKPPEPEPRQTAPIALEPARPEARRVEPPKVEAPKVEALKSEAPKVEAKPEPAKPEPAKPEPPRSEAVASRGLGAELRQTPRVKVPEAPRPTPVIAVVRRPARAAWPVFERKIAGSARFVRPWRVTSARWRGPSPGLPPRP